MKRLIAPPLLILLTISALAQDLPQIPFGESWKDSVSTLAPDSPMVPPKRPRRVLIFDLHTGYEHWVIPHTSALFQVLGEKSRAYESVISKDISVFEDLSGFDAVILNNTCSEREKRNMFRDALVEQISDTAQLQKAANRLEKKFLNYVKKGGGLAVVHGGITMQNKSMAFSEMVGGSFDYHPPQQEVIAEIVDKEHPITKPFRGEPLIHVDEPYFFNNAYSDLNFKPLLSMNTATLENMREPQPDEVKYIAWIKHYGKGRVFVASPSHNAQSFENSALLQFYLNGMQYVLGDLKCDDSPITLKP